MKNRRLNLVILATICIILFSALTFGSFFSKAEDYPDNSATYKYYTSIEIVSGDTLWDIATKYMSDEYSTIQDYIYEVKNINSLTTDEIHEGQFLTIPYYSNVFK